MFPQRDVRTHGRGDKTVSGNSDHDTPLRPALHVVSGEASAEELAALVTALTARIGPEDSARPQAPASPWSDRSRYLRTTLPHGPGAWRASALPR